MLDEELRRALVGALVGAVTFGAAVGALAGATGATGAEGTGVHITYVTGGLVPEG